jgi:hypothetical protein
MKRIEKVALGFGSGKQQAVIDIFQHIEASALEPC